MTGRRVRRGAFALLATTVLVAAGGGGSYPSPAFAQATVRTYDFDIPQKPVREALNDIVRVTGIDVVFGETPNASRAGQPVRGTMTAQQAVATLLSGTGLTHRSSGPRSVSVSDRDSAAHALPDADGATALSPIVVKGGRTPDDIPYETAGSVSHISAEQIDRVPPTSVGDIFKSAPGVIASGNRVGASVDVNIRGLQGQNRVNLMVDGTRQSSHSYRGYRGSRNEVFVDPDFLGGVDIAKGPSAGAGGVGAMGGVVNMRTLEGGDLLKPGDDWVLRVKGGLGGNSIAPPASALGFGFNPITFPRDASSDIFNGDAFSGSMVGAVAGEDYELLTGFSRRKSGNYFAGSNGHSTYSGKALSPIKPGKEVFNTSQDMESFLGKGSVQWGDGHSLSLSYIYYANEYGNIDENFLRYISGPTSYYRLAQNDLSRTQTHTAKAGYAYQFAHDNLLALNANAWLTDVATKGGIVNFYSGGTTSGGRKLTEVESAIRTLGGDVSTDWEFETGIGTLTMTNGVELVYETAKENGELGISGSYVGANPNGNRVLASAFNRSKLEINEWLSLTGGLRFDSFDNQGAHVALHDFDYASASRVNPSVGVTLQPIDGVQLFGSYAQGWRPFSLRETGVSTGFTPNPHLKPETSSNMEFGFNVRQDDVLRAGDALRLKVTYFDNSYDGFIGRERYVTPEGFWLYRWDNIADARFRGYETSASYDAEVFFVEAAFTYYTDVSFCRDKEANLITLVIPAGCGFEKLPFDYGMMNVPPKYSGSLTVGTRLFDQKLTLGARVYAFGERVGGYSHYTGSHTQAPGYHANRILDLFGSYKVDEDASLDFSVENVGDEYYLDPLSTGLVPSPGRTFRASFTKRF